MANLPETEDFSDGTYQIETSDRVVGGPGGIANKQAEQLGNRTAWLRAALAKVVDGTTSVGKATQLANLRALRFKGALSGSGSYDGSADTEITLTLADSGFAAGSYTRVTINAKGLVVSGESPTTLEGYGITDAVRANAAEITGRASDLADSRFVVMTEKTTDKPAAIAYGVGLHIKYPGFKQGFDLVSGVTSEWYGVRRVLEDGTGVYRKVWTDADFSPESYAPLVSPAFSGKPKAPTATAGTNNEQIANTAYVQAAISAIVDAAPGSLDTLKELAVALGNDANFSTTVLNALATKATSAELKLGLDKKLDIAGGQVGKLDVHITSQGVGVPGLMISNPDSGAANAVLGLSTTTSSMSVIHQAGSNSVAIRNPWNELGSLDAASVNSFGSPCHSAATFFKPVTGQWVKLTGSAILPAGGTWAYYAGYYNSNGGMLGSVAGIAAGGSTVGGGEISSGFAWRIQ